MIKSIHSSNLGECLDLLSKYRQGKPVNIVVDGQPTPMYIFDTISHLHSFEFLLRSER